jgi:hypothetical protein
LLDCVFTFGTPVVCVTTLSYITLFAFNMQTSKERIYFILLLRVNLAYFPIG